MAWYQFNISNDINAPSSRECHSINVRNESLILFGGNDNSSRMHDVYLMDTTTMKWSRLPPEGDAPVKRSAHSSALVDNRYMYVFGGWDGSTELGDIGIFDLVTKQWSKPKCTGTPPVPRHFHNTVFMGRHMYIFGGYDGSSWRKDMIALNVDTLQWDTVKPEDPNNTGPGPRASGSCVLIDQDKLLIFGGYNGDDFLNDMWILHTKNPVTGKLQYRWEQIKEPKLRKNEKSTWPSPRSGHAVEVFGNLLLIIGGRYKLGRFNDIVIFNLHTLTWHEYTPSGELFKPRKTHAIGRVGYQLWLFGGHDGTSWLGDLHMLDLRAIERIFLPNLYVTVPPTTIYKDLSTLIGRNNNTVWMTDYGNGNNGNKETKSKSNYMSSLLFGNGNGMYTDPSMVHYDTNSSSSTTYNHHQQPNSSNDDDDDQPVGVSNVFVHDMNQSTVSDRDQMMEDYTEWTNQNTVGNDNNNNNNNGLYSLASYEKYFRDRLGERKNNAHFLTPLSPNTSFTGILHNLSNHSQPNHSNNSNNNNQDILIDHDDQVSTTYPGTSQTGGGSIASQPSHQHATLLGEGPNHTATTHMLTSPHPPSSSSSSLVVASATTNSQHHHLHQYPSVFSHSPAFTDVTFIIENKSIPLHKCILASRCEYFRLMFSSTFTESQMSIIPLPEIELPVFMVIVRYLYVDQLPNEEELNSLCIPLLTQAQKMNLPRLSRLCQRYMETALCPDNAPVMLEVADTYNTRPLRKACIKYILQNYVAVSRSPGFIDLREDLLREILLRHARYEEQLEEEDTSNQSNGNNGSTVMHGIEPTPVNGNGSGINHSNSNNSNVTTNDGMILVNGTNNVPNSNPMTINTTAVHATNSTGNGSTMPITSVSHRVTVDPELGIPVTTLLGNTSSGNSNNGSVTSNNGGTISNGIQRNNSTNGNGNVSSTNNDIYRQLNNFVQHNGVAPGNSVFSPSSTSSAGNIPVSTSRRRSLLNHHFDTLDNTLLNVHHHRNSNRHHASHSSNNSSNSSSNGNNDTVTSPSQRIMMRMQQAHEQYQQQQQHRSTLPQPISSPSSSSSSSFSSSEGRSVITNAAMNDTSRHPNNSSNSSTTNNALLSTLLDPQLFATLLDITRTLPSTGSASSSSNYSNCTTGHSSTSTTSMGAQIAAAMMLAAVAADNGISTTGSNNTSLSSALNSSNSTVQHHHPSVVARTTNNNSNGGTIPSANKRRRQYTENPNHSSSTIDRSTDTTNDGDTTSVQLFHSNNNGHPNVSSISQHDTSLIPYDLLSEASEYDDSDSMNTSNHNILFPGNNTHQQQVSHNNNINDEDDILQEEDIHDMDFEHHRNTLLNRSSAGTNGGTSSGTSTSSSGNSNLPSPSTTPLLLVQRINNHQSITGTTSEYNNVPSVSSVSSSSLSNTDRSIVSPSTTATEEHLHQFHHRKGIMHGGDDHIRHHHHHHPSSTATATHNLAPHRSIGYQEIIDAITNGGGIPTTSTTVLPTDTNSVAMTTVTNNGNGSSTSANNLASYLLMTAQPQSLVDTSFSHGGGGSGNAALISSSSSPLNLSTISSHNNSVVTSAAQLSSSVAHMLSPNNNNISLPSVASVNTSTSSSVTTAATVSSAVGKRRRNGHTTIVSSSNNPLNTSNQNGGE